MPERSIPYRLLFAFVAFTFLAAACGRAQGIDVVRVERPDVEVRPTPAPLDRLHPITGRPSDGTEDWHHRPPLTIKIDNHGVARPQTNLEYADLVYVELVEGGITRFLAVFHSRGADRVGPVRSARHIDPQILAPLYGLFGYSGAIPEVIHLVRSTEGVADVGVDMIPRAYWRERGRRAPHNLYTSTANLWEGRSGGPPRHLFSFLSPADPHDEGGGESGLSVDVIHAPRSEPIRYDYDGGANTYARFQGGRPHMLESGGQVAPNNVIIQRIAPAVVMGEGEAILLRGGRAFHGRWVRHHVTEPTQFLHHDGTPMRLAPGQTWIELVSGPVTVR